MYYTRQSDRAVARMDGDVTVVCYSQEVEAFVNYNGEIEVEDIQMTKRGNLHQGMSR